MEIQASVICNPNRVPLFDFSFQIQLPEPIARVFRYDGPPFCILSFRPDHPEIGVSAQNGGSVHFCGPLRSTPNWQLAVDHLAAAPRLGITFWTKPDWCSEMWEPAPPDTVEFFFDGSFQVELRGEYIRRTLFVPLRFDSNSRSVVSLEPQPDTEGYRIARSVRFG